MSECIYITAAVLGMIGASVVIKYGQTFGLVDIPSDRSSHAKPTPKGGGIGILAAFILVAIWEDVSYWFWGPVAVVALISLIGDKIDLSSRFRLIVQFGAAIIVILAGIVGDSIKLLSFNTDMVLVETLVAIILLVFIAGSANIYNFMDGINGIAGITGVVGFGLLAFYAAISGADYSFVILSICISLSCLGFLPFNMPKARVFMGDVGSILLGFIFATMVIFLSEGLLDFICLAAFIFPFYADEITTMLVRIKDGEKLSEPHRRHLYQLLVNEYGVAHWKVSIGYGFAQLLVGMSALWFRYIGNIYMLSALVAFFCVFVILTYAVRRKL